MTGEPLSARRDLLILVLDTLVPPSREFPGAGAIALDHVLAVSAKSADVESVLSRGLNAVEEAARAGGAAGFAPLSADAREGVLKRVEQSHAESFSFLRPYLLAEHTGCAFTRDCLDNTRTTLTLPLVRLFAWNMPYHAEHHAYPAVPFHALPRLHGRVQGKIANLEPGYLAATVKVNRYLFGRQDVRLQRDVD